MSEQRHNYGWELEPDRRAILKCFRCGKVGTRLTDYADYNVADLHDLARSMSHDRSECVEALAPLRAKQESSTPRASGDRTAE